MQTKLQELTNKIYQEGVQKANDEASLLLSKARQEADQIVADAKAEAQRILEESEKRAEDKSRQVESELKLSASQTLSALKQTIIQLITLKVVNPGVGELFTDSKFLSSLLLKIVDGFAANGGSDLKVLLSPGDLKLLDQSIKASLADQLNKGLVVEADEKIKGGFKIGPKDGSYLISFTEEDFKNFFKNYLRSKSSELLFEN
jgi:V/A-type H+-transporting ATPase subunit E